MLCQKRWGRFIINGTKHFISHANIADFVIVFIATGEEEHQREEETNYMFPCG